MLPSYLLPTLALLWSITFISISTANPLRSSDIQDLSSYKRIAKNAEETSLFARSVLYQRHGQPREEAKSAPRKRAATSFGGYTLALHRQQSAIVPGISCAGTLKGFWQIISMKALYNNAFGEPTKELFTFTEGALQATFSSLGAEIPWDFVQGVAMRLVGMVDKGWTDVFDMIFEQEETGFVFWVSLRVLLRASRKTPSAPRG